MRVLQLGPYPPPHGGVQTNLVAIRRLLRQRGIPCAVINITGAPESGDEAVYYPRGAVSLLRLLARLKFDVVHLHLGGSLTPRLLGLAAVCALLPGRKSVLTFHSGGYPSSPEGRTARAGTLRGAVFRRFDRIIVVNQELAALFQRFGCRDEAIRLIPPHESPMLDATGDAAELPQSLREFLAAHEAVMTTVGLLEPEYDLARQIEAFPRIRSAVPGAGLLIIGSGSLEGELRTRIAQSPAAAHIRLAGDVPHDQTLRAIARSRAFLRTTLYDGDSISLREALALGTPVVATDTGMRPDGVRLIPIGDSDALIAAAAAAASAPREPRASEGTGNTEAVLGLYRELVA
ncbi:MAG TPA: glycosyltransferase family 4 protein [Gemmatimonadales bacterium]|nr:glycosyltransferase family 4 protein [Gemmatimonadales bacterium]